MRQMAAFRYGLLAALLVLPSLFYGCAAELVWVYKAGSATRPMTLAQAREAFLTTIKRARPTDYDESLTSRSYGYVTDAKFVRSGGHVAVLGTNGLGKPFSCVFRLPTKGSDVRQASRDALPYRVYFRPSFKECHAAPNPLLLCWSSFEDAKLYGEALNTLAHASPSELVAEAPAAVAAFQHTVRQYRSQSVKPELPEAARRLKVQAEAALKEKRYEDAIDLYEKGLQIAAWWPEGHFNRALLLGDQSDYDTAIAEMKRYLALEPNAPDARQAQDKIYEWEGKSK